MTEIKKIEGFTQLTKQEVLNACSHTSGLVPNFLLTDGKEYVRIELSLAAMSSWEQQQSRAKDERIKELEQGLRFILDVLPEVETMAVSKAKQLLNKK